MTTATFSSPGWDRLHLSLLEARSRAPSADVIQRLNRALLAGENVSAAFHDLCQRKLLQRRKALPLLTPEAENEIDRFLAEVTACSQQPPPAEMPLADTQRCVAEHSAGFRWQSASLLLAQNALFNRTWRHWQEAVEMLFCCEDVRPVFVRVSDILKDSAVKMAVLGDPDDLNPALQQLLATCAGRAEKCQASPDRLADFIAAADLITRSIIIFDATAEAVLRGRPLPGSGQLNARVKAHHLQVLERTHPWFTAV